MSWKPIGVLETHRSLNESYTTQDPGACGVYNTNTLNSDRLEVIIKYVQKINIGIIILIDTRADKGAAKHNSTQEKELLDVIIK